MPTSAGHARSGVWLAAAILASAAVACSGNGQATRQDAAANPAAAVAAPGGEGPGSTAPSDATPKTKSKVANKQAAAPSSTTSSTGPPRQFSPGKPSCGAETLRAELTTDKASYAVGEDVRLTGTITNGSSQTCAISTADEIVVADDSGAPFYEGTFDSGQVEQIEPGQSRVTTFTWRQQSCREAGCLEKAKPGRYTVTFRWSTTSQPIKASASFTIT